MIRKKWTIFFVILAVLAINFSFGFPRLSRFDAVDEPYWTYQRIPAFWNAIKANRWKSTNINDKPGITVALISGPGLFSINPMPYKSLRGDPKTQAVLNAIRKINFSFRLPILITSLLSLFAFYFLIKKLFNDKIAVFSIIFIFLSPIILGISLLINPDALLWIFLPLSMLSYFVFQKERDKKYLFLSGASLGFALLTKYVANILFVYFFAIIFLEYIFQDQKENITAYLKKELINYLLLALIASATFFVFFPATWVHPSMVLKGTFLSKAFQTTWPAFVGLILIIVIENLIFRGKFTDKALEFFSQKKNLLIKITGIIFLLIFFLVLANTYLGMKFYNFESTIASPKSGSSLTLNVSKIGGDVFSDFYGIAFSLTPIVFIFFLFSIFKNLKYTEKYKQESKIIFYLLFFIVLYYIASSVNGVVATIRYQIVIYPLASIIAAIGLSQFINIEKIKKYFPFWAVSAVIIIISFFSLYSIRPFYFSYASMLLPQKYVLNLKDMGDGSYEAAQYLNNLPNAQNLTVWSDKGAVCEGFVGKCVIGITKKDVTSARFDYFISSTGRKSRTFKLLGGTSQYVDLKKAYTTENYAYEIEIGNRPENVIKIVSSEIVYGN